MTKLTLDRATAIVGAALAAGREHGMMPLTVAVLDAGGHQVALMREDGSSILRPQIAIGKAWGALAMGVPSRTLRDRMAQSRPTFLNALAAASDGRVVPVPGGVLVRGDDGEIIGAVGISGDTSDKDEYCAIAGIRAANLTADPSEPDPGWASSGL